MPISDLSELLRNINPVLSDETFFLCFSAKDNPKFRSKAIGFFQEQEGMTYIFKNIDVPLQITKSEPQALITLNVNSDLQAVGFIAKISSILAEHHISINVISAFHHDHLFIAKSKALDVMNLLLEFQSRFQ
jgi:uncharacterized protein